MIFQISFFDYLLGYTQKAEQWPCNPPPQRYKKSLKYLLVCSVHIGPLFMEVPHPSSRGSLGHALQTSGEVHGKSIVAAVNTLVHFPPPPNERKNMDSLFVVIPTIP